MKISAKMRKLGTLCPNLNYSNSLLIRQLMRVSGAIIFLIIATVQVLLATSSRGQNMNTETVTIGLQHESLAACLKKIEKQSTLRFYYRKSDIKKYTNLNLPVETRTVEKTLSEVLQNTFLSHRQVDGSILLQRNVQQLSYQIKGRLLDNERKPVPFATVSIEKTVGDKIIQSTLTDTSGYFNLSVHEKGDCLINITAVGMDDLIVALTVADLKLVTIPDILLVKSINQLKEVVVVAKRPFIEQRIDRTVLNVENSILSSGKTALEVLANAPGVIVDSKDDNIRVNNKSGVTVMINGRKNFLSGADLSNMLRNMSSEQIATIDIITNPSAKYDASGTAGIIDIKLKTNKYFGTNGSASTTVSQGLVPYGPSNLSRAAVNLRLNNRTDRWNTYINFNPNRSADYSQTTLYRSVNFKSNVATFNGFYASPVNNEGLSIRTGIDYSASSKTVMGVLFEGAINQEELNDKSKTGINNFDSGVATLSSLSQNSNTRSPRRNVTTNFNLKHDFSEKGTTLTFDATYAGYNNEKDQTFDTDYLDNLDNLTDNTRHRNETDIRINIYTAKADITIPFSENFKFEAGIKRDNVRTENNGQFAQFISGAWKNVSARSNYFIYKENVNAAYINVNRKWTKWAIQAGLRAEHTRSNGNSVTEGKISDNSYLSLFPSIFVGQSIDNSNSVRYSYSRRIGRPNYQQLNPFVFQIDPYTIDQGNPFLKPQFTDSYQISYTYKNSITSSVGYSQTKNQIIQLTEQNDSTKVVKAIEGNLGRYKEFYGNISFPVKVSNWWAMQNQFGINSDTYSNKFSSGAEFNNTKLKYNFGIFNSFKLSDTWNTELSFNYVSPRAWGIERATKANYTTNAGVQKTFFEKRGRLSFNVTDIFLTSQYTGQVQYQNVDLSVINRWTGRRASLTFSYNFGKQTVKSPRDRSTGAETLKDRTN